MFAWLGVVLGVIALNGAVGEDLRARAYFDAHNVKVGDPLVLTIDFLGTADFSSLHPPALSKSVDRGLWKVDDSSAKTQTEKKREISSRRVREVSTLRTFIYRVRPLKEGVIWFPVLEFEYENESGEKKTAKTSAIPVHAVLGEQVVVAGMGEDERALPQPDALAGATAEVRARNPELRNDAAWFRWRKACANPTADAFAEFAFPDGRMNEARCAILEGNWARAMKVYSRLEWSVGQTPEIERGILAALAVRADSREVELPVWRQVCRPLLRYGWRGRAGIIVGGVALVVLLMWLIGRGIRALASVAVPVALTVALGVLPSAASAGIFDMMSEAMNMRMDFMKVEPEKVSVTVTTDRKTLQAGDEFKYVFRVEAPKNVTLENLTIQSTDDENLNVVGEAVMFDESGVSGSTNTVIRLEVPVRYDAPYREDLIFMVSGMQRKAFQRGGFSSSSLVSFRACTKPLKVNVRPLPTAGQPGDFRGIVAEKLTYDEVPDVMTVNSNDVIVISCVLECDGYVDPDFAPDGVAYEWRRTRNSAEWKRYFVADGAKELPQTEISYYNPKTKTYKRVKSRKRRITYR